MTIIGLERNRIMMEIMADEPIYSCLAASSSRIANSVFPQTLY